jgi:hypothetical protein
MSLKKNSCFNFMKRLWARNLEFAKGGFHQDYIRHDLRPVHAVADAAG